MSIASNKENLKTFGKKLANFFSPPKIRIGYCDVYDGKTQYINHPQIITDQNGDSHCVCPLGRITCNKATEVITNAK